MSIRYRNENGEWITGQKAIETSIVDLEGNFTEKNVEGALRELAEKVGEGADTKELKAKIEANSYKIDTASKKIERIEDMIEDGSIGGGGDVTSSQFNSALNRIDQLEEDVEWLKVNGGGGGGGSAIPTISSDFQDCAIDKGTDVIIPIFFSSPNMGDGTAYILINNIQVDTAGIKQGNNEIKVLAQYITKTDNKIAIYAKDRAGIVTNQLSWTVIAGGIELTSTFDYEVDYGITDTIRIPYTIETGIDAPIITTLTIDNVPKEYSSLNGNNFIDLQGSELGLGTHSVTMVSKVDKYTSRTLSFNIVIISTTELYLSSTFVNDSQFVYGVPVTINYRLSKQSTEEFNVYLKINGEVNKTQKLVVGSYYWTLPSLRIGSYTIEIQVVSLDQSEDKSLTLSFEIIEGEYTPVEPYTLGLLCDLNASGLSNEDDNVINRNLWIDASGNGHNGELKNFNFGTNGFINNELICDNDAYVVIPWSPWAENALNGSTIDIIYTPINSGIEECRVMDYTEITDNLSTAEIKPFKGVFADTRQCISCSASSGVNDTLVNLDDQNGEIHLTFVLDRINKFMKTYIDGVLCRIKYLTDSGTGVNKFYEDYSLDSFIYLNSTKGDNAGTNNIKRFRVYDHALTSEQVLQNHLANITDLQLQKEQYNFNYNNTSLPKMYLTGDITNMTNKQSVPMKIEYISPNEEKYGQSFNTGIQNNPVLIQGTSSLQYVRKNYTIYLKDEYGADFYYNPYGKGSVADYVFCLKADKHFKYSPL